MKPIQIFVALVAGWLSMLSASAATDTQFVGFMTTNQEWLDSSDPTAAYGFYGFNTTGEGGFRPLSPTGPDNAWANCGSVYVDGKYYCYDVYGSWTLYTLTYRVIDAATWDITDTKSFTFTYSSSSSEESTNARNIPCALAHDPISGTIWAVTHAFSNTESVKLCKVDTATGRLIVVTDLPAIRVAACDANGNLFGIGLDSKLYAIGKDGNCTEIGETGFWPTRDSEIKTGATIDYRSGKMYWSTFGFPSENDRNYNINAISGLVEIDLTTAESKLLYGYAADQRFSSLTIANAHPQAPDLIADLLYTADTDYTKGTLTFTVPNVTYGQQPLTGSVNVSIVLDGKVDRTLTATPGQKVSQTFQGMSQGTHNLAVTLNANGHNGVTASTNFYVGPYTPSSVTDLTLAYDKDSDSAVLTWSTPADANGGTGSTENLRYRIERMPDNVIVARSARGNTFSDKATFPWNSCYYRITPYVGNEYGPTSRSNTVTMGAPRELPFDETFDTASSLNPFTRIDANGDGNGSDWDTPEWIYDEQYACAFYYGKRDKPADDWLILPSLKFETGNVYAITFKYYAYYGYGSKFRVVVGSQNNVDAMDFEVLDKETVSSFADRPGITETVYFAPREGDKFIGFHHISETMEHLSIDDIHVERFCSAEIPARVDDLKAAKAGPSDVLLSFNLPTLNAGRGELQGPLTVKVYKNRGEEPVLTLTDKKPGEKITWTDADVLSAVHTYRVVASNSVGDGYESEVSIDMRKGTPAPVAGVVATLVNNNQIVLQWPESTDETDADGNRIDVENIRYLVYKPVPDDEGNVEYRLIARDLDVCYFIDSDPRAGLGDGPQYVMYYVAPINADDEGYATASNSILLSDSKTLPYEESWPDQTMENGLWFRAYPHNATWYIRYKGYDPMVDAFDGSGVASCETDRDQPFGSGAILSPRLNLSVVDDPVLTFYMYQGTEYEDGVQLAVGVDWGDGAQHLIPGAVYNAKADESGWKQIQVPLTGYTSHQSVSIAFFGYTVPDNTIHIDKVSVTGTAHNKELALTGVNTPALTRTGVPVTIDVDLANMGSVASGATSLEMKNGDKVLATQNVDGIKPGESAKIKLSYTPADDDAGKVVLLDFNLKNSESYDTNPENNTLSAYTEVKQSNSFRVSKLDGQIAGSRINLQWNVPDEAEFPETFVDDVENYRSFAIDNVGSWTMHDADQGYNYLMADGTGGTFEWENCREKQAFIVFDTKEFANSLDAVPTSGNKYFAAWPAATTSNDDWLISPQLPGNAQLISFYARSLKAGTDAIEVCVSENGTEPESFRVISGSAPISIAAEWRLYHFALPEGTRHFAIRYVGKDGEGIMIDDIMYFGNPVVAPDGYNIYRNGIKINTELIKSLSFTDTNIEPYSAYRYHVAPVYNGVEMEKSDELLLETSAIGIIDSDNNAAIVKPVAGGVEVIGAEGRLVNVYSIDSKLVASVTATERQHIDLAPGIYIVNIGRMNVKVAVR